LSATSGDLVGVLEQADKHPAIKRTTMELNNFSDLIFPDPFAKH
jgi:hypothetical protein